MAKILDYVNVQITSEASRLARLGFNVPVFLFESDTLDRTKIVSTADYEDADLGGTSSQLYKAFQTYLSQPLIASTAVIACKKSTDATWADAISAIRAENDNWYGGILVSRVKADILAVSAVFETITPGRLLFATTADASVLAKTDDGSDDKNVAQRLADSGYYRTALTYSSDTNGWANAGQCAYLSYNPGSITFNYKEIVGITAEALTAAQRQNLIDQQCQVQQTVAGLKRLVDSGMVASGEWIDVMLGIDWLTARISEGVFAILARSPKVPYTNSGIAILECEIIRNLIVASGNPYNLIKDDYTVSVPDAVGVDSVNKANRLLENVTFTANLQGAIHLVTITGTLIA